MFKKHFTVLLLIFFVTQSSYSQYLRLDAATSPVDPSNVYQDGANIGIGTATPAARLDVNVSAADDANLTSPYNLLQVGCNTFTSFPSFVNRTQFVVTNEGNVAIGNGDPFAPLHIRAKGWNTDPDELGKIVWAVSDDNYEMVAALFNTGTSTASAGLLAIIGNPANSQPAFAILNNSDEYISFGASADGTVAVGFDISGFSSGTPVAQLDIRKFNTVDHLLNVSGSPNGTDNYFSIANDGYVGFGVQATNNALVQINGDATATGGKLFWITNDDPNDTRLVIKEDGAGIGIDNFSTLNSTLALKGSNWTALDFYENSNELAGLRWVSSSGDVRHVIDDESDDLVINPGYGGGANDKVVVQGNEDVTKQLHLGLDAGTSEPLLIGDRWAFHNGGYKTINYNAKWNTSTSHNERIVDGPYAGIVFTNNGDLELRTAPDDVAGTDVGAVVHFAINNAGKTFINQSNVSGMGAPGNYSLYVGSGGVHADHARVTDKLIVGNQTLNSSSSHVGAKLTVDGKMVAQSCIITLDHWADDVFSKDYKLPSLHEVSSYITKHKHLEGIPSEKEVLENGIALEEMNVKLLRKVEELTLYVLSLKQENEEIKTAIANSKKQ